MLGAVSASGSLTPAAAASGDAAADLIQQATGPGGLVDTRILADLLNAPGAAGLLSSVRGLLDLNDVVRLTHDLGGSTELTGGLLSGPERVLDSTLGTVADPIYTSNGERYQAAQTVVDSETRRDDADLQRTLSSYTKQDRPMTADRYLVRVASPAERPEQR